MRLEPQPQDSSPQVPRAAGTHDKRIGQITNATGQQTTRDGPCCIGECDREMTPQPLRPALVGVRDMRRPPAFTAKDARGQCPTPAERRGGKAGVSTYRTRGSRK